ncbi:hypothetical protein M1403_03975 [Patescibacteria group bacterium]|nr:hypothetical protein [Patescibacteria group bacterium]
MSLPRYLQIILGIVGFIFIGNLVLLDYFFVSQRGDLLDFQARLSQLSGSFTNLSARIYTAPAGNPAEVKSPTPAPAPTNEACPQTCLTAIDTAVKTVNTSRSVVTTTTTAPAAPRGEYFIPLGSGSVSNTDYSNTNWKTIDAAQATFDISNYGNVKAVYFEATLRNGSIGEAHARLFDSTTPLVFFNSEVYASTSTATFISTPISITSPGPKTYKVQMYSTLSTGYLDQARIRIVTQ